MSSEVRQNPATRQNQEVIISMLRDITDQDESGYPDSAYSKPGVAQNPATRQNQEVIINQLQEIIDSGGGGGASIDLGITGASVGQLAQVLTVDADGKPTAWAAVGAINNEEIDAITSL